MWTAWGNQNAGGAGGAGAYVGAGGNQKRSFGAAFEEQASLQDVIKNLQRTDPDAKEQWITYCEQYGDNRRDPMKHDETFIQNFLTAYNSGQRFEGGEDVGIANVTKLLQKRSSTFKQVWAQFCLANGGGKNDPSKHEASFHVQFYDMLAQKAMFGMMGGGNMKAMGNGGASGMGAMGGMAAMGGGSELVARIKAYQKMGEVQKQAWWTHCDTMLGGVRDPARHDEGTLQAFIDSHGVPEVDASSNGMGGGCMAGMMGMGMGMGMGTGAGGAGMPPVTIDDPQKQALVDRIKAFQKGNEQQKEAWYSYCGKVKDPARHETASLQEFINSYGVP